MKNSMPQNKSDKLQSTTISKIANIFGIILCVVFLFPFIVNTTLLVNSLINPDVPPGFMGYTPLVVETGSMSPFFNEDDLIIVNGNNDAAAYENEEVICFRSGNSYVTHRIIDVQNADDGSRSYITQGDANNTPDVDPVSPEKVLGSYVTHFTGLGGFVVFMQTPKGMVCCVLLPLLAIFSIFWGAQKISAAVNKKREQQAETASN